MVEGEVGDLEGEVAEEDVVIVGGGDREAGPDELATTVHAVWEDGFTEVAKVGPGFDDGRSGRKWRVGRRWGTEEFWEATLDDAVAVFFVPGPVEGFLGRGHGDGLGMCRFVESMVRGWLVCELGGKRGGSRDGQ